MNVYDVGDLVRISVEFKDSAGALADPTAVSVRLKDPNGTVTTPAAVKDAVGKYHLDVSVTTAGIWIYYIAGTGAVQSAASGQFRALKDPTT